MRGKEDFHDDKDQDDNNSDGDGDDNDDGGGDHFLSWDDRNRRHYYDWMGFAPAGRLDLDSTGLLVFTKNGVLAKKLIGASSSVEKEYIVDVEPAVKPTKREYAIDPNFVLPSSSEQRQRLFDLTHILRGGEFLLGDDRPLKPCPLVRWIVKGERLQIVLTEGRKHHIRRMCRELLGFHVIGLRRVRIGPIILLPSSNIDTTADDTTTDDSKYKYNNEEEEEEKNVLPEGCWRPLSQKEMEVLLPNFRQS